MITQEKIKIYKKFEGDIDGWARTGSKNQKEVMNDADWFFINSVLQDIALARTGLASKEFSDNLYKKLKDNSDSEQTINQLKILAENQ